jgi:type VI secretion system secreted protein VgrG
MAGRMIKFELDGFDAEFFDVVSFSGTEGISMPWCYTITLLSREKDHDFDKMLEAKAHLSFGEPPVHLHGMLCSVQQGFDGTWKVDSDKRTRIDVQLVPNLWKATLNVVTRFFRNMTVGEIVNKVLQEHGLSPKFNLSGKHPKHSSILQYQESDLDFVQRLCEHEGIHYHLIHKEGDEDLVFGDANGVFEKIPDPSDLPLRLPRPSLTPGAHAGPWGDEKTIRRLQNRQRFVSKTVKLKDYYDQTPSHDLEVAGDTTDKAALGTQYFYGEHYKDTDQGKVLVGLRKEEILARKNGTVGASNDYMLYAGGVFNVIEADLVAPNLAGEYIVTDLTCEGSQLIERAQGAGAGNDYRCTFTCIPSKVVYRPPLRTRWPVMTGVFHAKVLASGDEYADVEKQGRYQVQFLFDTDGAGSIPVRRMQDYVGGSYGFHAPLHKGVEVLVAFENGDPDRPIIVAAAHNPDFPDTVVADNHFQSVWRSGGNNEFMMQDTKGEEKFYQHCEKDLEIKTENDKTEVTGHDEKLEVGNDRTRLVKNNEKVEVSVNREKKIGADETIEIGGNKKSLIKGNKEATVNGNFTEKVDGNEDVTVGGNVTTEISGNSDLAVKGSKTEEIDGDSEAEAGGKITFEAGASIDSEAGSDITFEAGSNIQSEAGAEIGMEAGTDIGIEAGGDIGVEAGMGVEMESGLGFEISAGIGFEVEANAGVEIKAGTEMELEGSSGVSVKGAKFEVTADGEVTVKGAMVKLN